MVDVCLILEGTYPYVAGGVSTWVHQLISSMKDIRFGILSIFPHYDPEREPKYAVPSHVIYLKEIYLHDYSLQSSRRRNPKKADFEALRCFYEEVGQHRYDRFSEVVRLFRGDERCFDSEILFSSREIWDLLTSFYEKISPDISFLDFFWTWRGSHLPLFQIVQEDLIHAKIYHALSTGYAGLLGAIAKATTQGKFFLTEHGIYTRERVLEISQANWIYEEEKKNFRAERDLSFFKKWWISLFEFMSHITYHHADRIFTLYEGNRILEILGGASPDKVSIIPNGINIPEFSSIRREEKKQPQIALMGRVVSIKDIKTFIEAANLVLRKIPDARFLIIGPTDEEEDYYEECRTLVESLHLENSVIFTGRLEVKECYRSIDIIVLTSLSEAQPYVVLEANSIGIPVVATDVGSCRELLEGRSPDDRALGPSGLLTEVSNPAETAEAIMRLVEDAPLNKQLSQAGYKRVRKFYDQDDLLSRYLNIYEQNL